jgi:ABC-type Co2+ transport system permease subunit
VGFLNLAVAFAMAAMAVVARAYRLLRARQENRERAAKRVLLDAAVQ